MPYEFADDLGNRSQEIKTKIEKESKKNAVGRLGFHEKAFREIHALVTKNLPHPYSQPGKYRNNVKQAPTIVSNQELGGTYKPPQYLKDIEKLMHALTAWAHSDPVKLLPALYRAPLVHYYFELIHPFWDGNGRVGRIIEAMILRTEYQYGAHAISNYYLRHIDQYFSLFNACRKSAEKKEPYPLTNFVTFFLQGTLDTFNRLQDKVNEEITHLLYKQHLTKLINEKKINQRQLAIVHHLLKNPNVTLEKQSWYQAMYADYHGRTKGRDLQKLQELGLIQFDDNGEVSLCNSKPNYRLAEHPITSDLN